MKKMHMADNGDILRLEERIIKENCTGCYYYKKRCSRFSPGCVAGYMWKLAYNKESVDLIIKIYRNCVGLHCVTDNGYKEIKEILTCIAEKQNKEINN